MDDKTLKSCQFPENLKLADITPVFKGDNKKLVKNYRPVNVLPTFSKVFEKIIEKQIVNHVNTFLSPCLWLQKQVQYLICSFVITRKVEKDHFREE